MKKVTAQYLKNAAVKPFKAIKEVADNVVAPIQGAIADNKRGDMLWRKGYGEYYDSENKVANDVSRTGKAANKKRKARRD